MSPIDESRPFIPLSIAVLTVSDTRSLDEDRSGTVLADRLQAAGHHLADRAIVTDDVPVIAARIQAWVADAGVDIVLTTGGTGFTGRDVTPDAIEPLFTKRMDGFSTLFHQISYDKIGTSTLQSRATAGLIDTTFVFCLPGSPGACKDGWDGILKWQLDYRHMPCNFVEIMPRLDEHLKRGAGKARGFAFADRLFRHVERLRQMGARAKPQQIDQLDRRIAGAPIDRRRCRPGEVAAAHEDALRQLGNRDQSIGGEHHDPPTQIGAAHFRFILRAERG